MSATLGILGLGERSTLFYRDKLAAMLSQNPLPAELPNVILVQLDFEPINEQLPDNHAVISELLKPALAQLQSAGVTHLLVPNITLHKVLDEIEMNWELFHPIELMKTELAARSGKAMVIGTRHTSQNSFIGKAVLDAQIELQQADTITIEMADRLRIDVYSSNEQTEQIESFNVAIKELAEDSTIIIACAELSIVNTNPHLTLDLANLQIQAAVRFLFQEQTLLY